MLKHLNPQTPTSLPIQMLDTKHQHDAELLFAENDVGKKGYLDKPEVRKYRHLPSPITRGWPLDLQ
jgi:hypothetical protein